MRARRVVRVLVGLSVAAVVVAGCGEKVDDSETDGDVLETVEYLNRYLSEAGVELPTDTVEVEVTLGLGKDSCRVAEVDGVKRYPIWPTGTDWKNAEDDVDVYVIILPDGKELRFSRGKPVKFTAQALIDEDRTFFGAGPAGVAFSERWLPLNMYIKGCGLKDVGVIIFPDERSIKSEN